MVGDKPVCTMATLQAFFTVLCSYRLLLTCLNRTHLKPLQVDAAARPLDGKAISAALHAASRAHVLGSAQAGDKLDDGSGSSMRGGSAMGSDQHRAAAPAPQDSGSRQASSVLQDSSGARTAGRAVASTDSVRARRASAELPQSEDHPLQPDTSSLAADAAAGPTAGRLQSQESRSGAASPAYDSKRSLLPPRDASGASATAAAASRSVSGEPSGSQPPGAVASARARERGRRSTMDSGVVSSLLEGGRAAMSGLSGRRPTASPVVPLRGSLDAGATAEALADTVMANLVARFGRAAAGAGAGAGGTSSGQAQQQQVPDPALVLGHGDKLLSGRRNRSIGGPDDEVAAADGAARSLQQARRASFSMGMPMPPGQHDLWASRLPSMGRPAAASAPVNAAAAGSSSPPPLSSASSDTDDSPSQQQQQSPSASQPGGLGPSFSMQERIPSGTSGQLRGPLAARPASFAASPRGANSRPTRFHPGGGASLHEHVPQQQQLTLPPQQPQSGNGSGNEGSTHGQARAEADGLLAGLALPMPPAAVPPGANVGTASEVWDAGRDGSPPPVAQGMRVPMSRGAPAIEALPQVRLTTARGRRPPQPTSSQALPVPQQSQQLQQQAQEGERRLKASPSGALAAPSAEQDGHSQLPGPDPSLPGLTDHRHPLSKAWGTMQPVRSDTEGSGGGRAPLSRNPTLGSRNARVPSRNVSMHWATAVGRTLATPDPQLGDESTERQLQLLDQELDQEDAPSQPRHQVEQQHAASGGGSGASPARAAATLTGSSSQRSPSASPAEDATARANSGAPQAPSGPGPVAEATEEPQQAQPQQQQQPQGPSTRVPAALALQLDGHIDSVPSTPMAGETTRGTGMSPYSPGPGTRGTYVSVSQLDQLDSHYVDSPGVQEVLRHGIGAGVADGGAGGAMFNARAGPSAAALRYAWVTRGVLALTAHLEAMLKQLREAIAELEVRYMT